MQWCIGGHDRPQEISGELFSLRTSQVLLLPRASWLENLTTCGPASPFPAEPAKELLKALVYVATGGGSSDNSGQYKGTWGVALGA